MFWSIYETITDRAERLLVCALPRTGRVRVRLFLVEMRLAHPPIDLIILAFRVPAGGATAVPIVRAILRSPVMRTEVHFNVAEGYTVHNALQDSLRGRLSPPGAGRIGARVASLPNRTTRLVRPTVDQRFADGERNRNPSRSAVFKVEPPRSGAIGNRRGRFLYRKRGANWRRTGARLLRVSQCIPNFQRLHAGCKCEAAGDRA